MKKTDMKLTTELNRKLQQRLDKAAAEDDGTGMMLTREIGEIGRELGVQRVCRIANLERTSFYRTFDGMTDPRFSNVYRVIKALGLTLTLRYSRNHPHGKFEESLTTHDWCTSLTLTARGFARASR